MDKVHIKHPVIFGIAVFIVIALMVATFTTPIADLFEDYWAWRDFSRGVFMLCGGITIMALGVEPKDMKKMRFAGILMMAFGLIEIIMGTCGGFSLWIDINLAPDLPTAPEGVLPGGDITPIVPAD